MTAVLGCVFAFEHWAAGLVLGRVIMGGVSIKSPLQYDAVPLISTLAGMDQPLSLALLRTDTRGYVSGCGTVIMMQVCMKPLRLCNFLSAVEDRGTWRLQKPVSL